LSVTATDPAGNTSAPTPLPITIDTTPPAAPTASRCVLAALLRARPTPFRDWL
jgi:hypothetical protein